MSIFKTDYPYRIFFPFSVAGALLGLSQFFWSYSGDAIFWHREIMITLFLLPAATGFLFTASPRFLIAKPAQPAEIGLMIGLFTLLFIAYLLHSAALFIWVKGSTVLSILIFFGRRWWKRRTKNPYWPPFILTSMLTGLVGSVLQGIRQLTTLASLGDMLYYDAMFWILLFGIGIKFFPMLTAAAPPVYRTDKRSLLTKTVYEGNWLWYSVALLCVLSFMVQYFVHVKTGLWMRTCLLFFIAYEGWGILEKPHRDGFTSKVLLICLWTLLAGHVLFPFFPQLLPHFYHIVFVGGFLSITLMVETRVLLSHDQLDLSVEQQSRWLLTAYILFFLALLTRVSAIFLPENYVSHLIYASVAAVSGLLILLGAMWKAYRKKSLQTKFPE